METKCDSFFLFSFVGLCTLLWWSLIYGRRSVCSWLPLQFGCLEVHIKDSFSASSSTCQVCEVGTWGWWFSRYYLSGTRVILQRRQGWMILSDLFSFVHIRGHLSNCLAPGMELLFWGGISPNHFNQWSLQGNIGKNMYMILIYQYNV